MKTFVSVSGLDDVLRMLQQLPEEVVSKRGGPVRYALAKGARLIREEAKRNFAAAVALPGKTGITDSTGFTEKQIVMIRKRPLGGEKGERMIVTVRYVPHPSNKASRRKSRSTGKRKARPRKIISLRANDIGFMMEYGTSKQEATPWLRPAFQSKAEESIKVISENLVERINKIIKKLARQTT